ncbi:MAG: hypothetical protein OXE53_13100 [Deltaproteobacteria bacterium]|nr:hypothetical protein [Deltaproteobacteria bacterium]
MTYLKVVAGTEDLSAWLVGATWEAQLDAGAGKATIRLNAKDPDGNHVAPLIASILHVGQRLKINLANRETPGIPADADYTEVYDGEIADVSWPAAEVTVTCRERGMANAATQWVEDETAYGTEEGKALHLVMRDVLAGWLPGSSLVVKGGDSEAPGFLIRAYNQKQEPVLRALETLASLAGWTVQQRWDPDTEAFALTLLRPDREGTVADWSFTMNDYIDMTEMRTGLDRVRNVVDVEWSDDEGTHRTTRSDGASIARIGRRWMRHGATSQIDTEEEAVTLAEAILSDLSLPNVDVTLETGLFWPVELSDLLQLPADMRHWTASQKLGVVGYRHEWSGPKEDRSFIRMSGKPSAGKAKWITVAVPVPEPVAGEITYNGPKVQSFSIGIVNYRVVGLQNVKTTVPDATLVWRLDDGPWQDGTVAADASDAPTLAQDRVTFVDTPEGRTFLILTVGWGTGAHFVTFASRTGTEAAYVYTTRVSIPLTGGASLEDANRVVTEPPTAASTAGDPPGTLYHQLEE